MKEKLTIKPIAQAITLLALIISPLAPHVQLVESFTLYTLLSWVFIFPVYCVFGAPLWD